MIKSSCIILFLLYFLQLCMGTGHMFSQLYDCNCLGYIQTFECRVCGAGATVWRGTAFDCDPNEIRLRHSQYTSSQVDGVCNDGAIQARSVGVEGGCFTSMLNVTVEADMINKTIECVYHDLQTSNKTIIGIGILRNTEALYISPSQLQVENIHKDHLVFSWSPVSFQCPSVRYVITSVDCGACPNIITNTTATCLQLNVNESNSHVCMFAVQTELCGSILGNRSEPISLNLGIPAPPRFKLIFNPHASENVTFEIQLHRTTEEMHIDAVQKNGDTSYTIQYSDLKTGRLCGLNTIHVSEMFCRDQDRTSIMCFHTLQIDPPCFLSCDISMSMSATNVFGTGPFSELVIVRVIYNTSNRCGQIDMGECSNSQFNLLWPVFTAVSFLIMISVVTCTAVNIKLCKDKAQLLKTVRSSNPQEMFVREPIVNSEVVELYRVSTSTVSDIVTNKNSAYSTVK